MMRNWSKSPDSERQERVADAGTWDRHNGIVSCFRLFACFALAGLMAIGSARAVERPIRFDRLSLNEGLSQSSVLSVLQDSRGYVWIGTEDGLNRYDGLTFTVFKHDPLEPGSIPGNFVWAIDEDPSGNLWVGTEDGGVGRLDRQTGKFSHVDVGAERTVRALHVDTDGTVWVGTRETGLRRIDSKTAAVTTFRSDPDGLPDDHIYSIHRDRAGRLWVGTDSGLARFDAVRGSFERAGDAANGLSGSRIRSIIDDQQGRLWVGTYENGLNRLNPVSGEVVRFRHDDKDAASLSHDRVRALFEDADGRIWVGTSAGLDLHNPRREAFEAYAKDPTDPFSLADDHVMSIAADRAGVMWVGTRFGGVHKWSPRTWQFNHRRSIDPAADSEPSRVTSFTEDAGGRLWVGAFGDGLSVFDSHDGSVVRYRHDSAKASSLSSDRVTALATDHHGRVWVGTLDGGLNRFDADSGGFAHYGHDANTPGTLSANGVSSIVEDRSGTLWIGTFGGGLDRLDSRTMTFTNFRHDPDNPHTLGSNRVTAVALTDHEQIWIGTHGGGIALLDPASGHATRFQHDSSNPASLGSDLVYSTFVDAGGALWVGTTGGLSYLAPQDAASGEFRNYRERDGLPNNVIYGIQQDRAGLVWVSTNHGLASLDPEKGTIQTYDITDGLQDLEFNFGAAFTRWNGQMLFGGINGYNAFTPGRLEGNEHAPSVIMTSLSLNHQPFEGPTDQVSRVKLDYRDRVVSFKFAALDFTDPDKNRFAYRLDGFDEEWVQAGTDNRLTYTNLDPGHYTLQVLAANADGVWNDEGLTVELEVEAPPWQSPWAYGGYTFSALGFLFGFVQVQRHKVAREAEYGRILEAQVRHRTMQLTHRTQELEVVNKQLTTASLTDSLTGFANRRFLTEYLEKETSLVRRRYETADQDRLGPSSFDLSFMMIDLDEFKSINDTFGHAAGDEVLRQLRSILDEVCRSSDIVIRWGGDEFLVVARDLDSRNLGGLAERIRTRIASHPFAVGEGQVVRTTCSIGYACYPFIRTDVNALSWEQVIAVADRALYVSKHSGRNAWVGLESTEKTDDETLLAELRYGAERLVADGHLNFDTSIDRKTRKIAWALED